MDKRSKSGKNLEDFGRGGGLLTMIMDERSTTAVRQPIRWVRLFGEKKMWCR